jgi:hypothetical protein
MSGCGMSHSATRRMNKHFVTFFNIRMVLNTARQSVQQVLQQQLLQT